MVARAKGQLGFKVGNSSKTNLTSISTHLIKKTFLNKKPRLVVVAFGPQYSPKQSKPTSICYIQHHLCKSRELTGGSPGRCIWMPIVYRHVRNLTAGAI